MKNNPDQPLTSDSAAEVPGRMADAPASNEEPAHPQVENSGETDAPNAGEGLPAADGSEVEAPADDSDPTRPRSAFAPGNAPPRAVVEWVASSLAVRGLKPADAPDSTAWGLLHWARASSSNTSSFYQMWAKLLPTRAQADEQDTKNDDAGDLLDSIEFVYNAKRAALLRVSAEGLT